MDLGALGSPARGAAPAWATLLLGWCLGAAWCERDEARALATLVGRVPSMTGPSMTGPSVEGSSAKGPSVEGSSVEGPSAPTTRALRAVEGVGAARAVDLARWFWAQGGAPGDPWSRLEAVPGVGPTLAARLAAQLAPAAGPGEPEPERRAGPG